jgi:hypothetical protein
MSVCFKPFSNNLSRMGSFFGCQLFSCCCLFVLSFTAMSQAAPALTFGLDRLIVQYRPTGDAQQSPFSTQAQVMRGSRKQILLSQQQRQDGKGDLAVVQLPAAMKSTKDLATTLTKLQADPAIEYAVC